MRGILQAAAFRFHHWRLWNTGSPAVAPLKPHEENIFGKPEFLPRNSDPFIRHHWTRHCARFRCDGGRQLFVHRFWRRASDATRCKVRIVLALAVVAASASSAFAAPPTGGPFRLPLLCTRSGEKISGLTKICYYSCAKSEGAMTATTYEDCPRWTARWQLNQSAQFGPNENPR